MSEYYRIIDNTYELQKANQEKLTIQQRKAYLKSLRTTLISHRQQIEEALYLDLKKSSTEASISELLPLILEIDLFIKNMDAWLKPKRVSNNFFFFGAKAYTTLEPWGMALIISPWNYPFQLPILHLISSVAAGNRTIIKPSEFTPNTNKTLIQIINKVFPPKWVQVIEGDADTTTYIIQKGFDHIHFTGSPAVGKKIMAAASEHLTHCTLELGGKSPFIIDDKYDMVRAVQKLILGKFINLGQTCIAPDYVMIPQNRKDEFITTFNQEIQKAFGADPALSDQLARIINEKQFKRLKQHLDDALSNGGTLYYGGETIENERYIAPTLIGDLKENDVLLQEEIFGPIIPIVTFEKISIAKSFILSKPKPLAMYLFTDDHRWINYFNKHTSSGALVVNDVLVHIMHPNLPFGGANNSGLGYATGKFGIEDFSHIKPILKTNKFTSPTNFMHLPIKKSFNKILDYFIK